MALEVIIISNNVCDGTASACAIASGGVEPYLYSWTAIGFPTSNDICIIDIDPGEYTVQVTDADLVVVEAIVTISECEIAPLLLNFTLCESSDCSELIFSDITGAYNNLDNSGGYGVETNQTSDFTFAKIEIFNSLDVLIKTYTFDNVTFPTSNTSFEYILDEIADGRYSIKYTIASDDSEDPELIFTKTIYKTFYCNVRCCVYSMFNDLNHECSDCDKKEKQKALDAHLLLKGLIYSSNGGSIDNFDKELESLQKICKNINCKNCK